jgi:hypothetical protein
MSNEDHNVDVDAEVDGTQPDQINTGALGTLVAVGLFAMISIATAVTALVRHDMEEEQAEKDADSNQVVIALKDSQRAVLNAPAGYVDRAKGVVSMPIDLAKQAVLGDLARDPNSATPPATAAPASPAPTAATSAAPADSAKKPEETGTSAGNKKTPAGKPEGGTMAPGKPAPAAPQPTAPPLTPTAASPGAKAPGPLNH